MAGTVSGRKFVLAAAPGVILSVLFWWSRMDLITAGKNDFAAFYAGARIVGTADIYHAPTVLRAQEEALGRYCPALHYIRLPHVAVLLWPFGRLPYISAYWSFQAASLAALAAFVLLWPGDRRLALLACCWSVPVSTVLANGQDVLFLLLWIALALRWRETRPFVAGLMLALCAAKFHLFIHVPLVLIAQRKWRMGAGLLAGGAGILTLSFAVAGVDWPARFLAAALSTSVSPAEQIMPNLHHLLSGAAGRAVWEGLLTVACASAVWMAARRATFNLGFAAALMAGVLTSVHAYPQDCALLIPAALLLLESPAPALRMGGIVMLLPVWYLLLHSGWPAGRIVPAGLLAMLCALAWFSRSGSREEESRHARPAAALR